MRGRKQLQEKSGSKRGTGGGWDGVGGLVIRDTLLDGVCYLRHWESRDRTLLELSWDKKDKRTLLPLGECLFKLRGGCRQGTRAKRMNAGSEKTGNLLKLVAGGRLKVVMVLTWPSWASVDGFLRFQGSTRGFPWLISCPRRVGFGCRQPRARGCYRARAERRAARTETFH